MPERLLQRLAVEDFLYREAALLDAWRLDDWLELYAPDCRYVVPATDLPDGDPRVTLGLIDDDRARLRGRVDRLKSAKAYREFPWSRTLRLVSNVRLLDAPDGELAVASAFAAYRYRKGDEQVLSGTYEHRLAETAGGDFRITLKRIVLTPEALRPHGTLSIIL
jgi:p-cumate 2,3-dioxygenase beta subunit